MNKREVDKQLSKACEVLELKKIAVNGVVDNGFKGQISSFGAAITMGSLLSAVSFFSHQAGSEVDRGKIIEAVQELVIPDKNEKLFNYLKNKIYPKEGYSRHEEQIQKEKVINATIALKLALNLYKIEKKSKKEEENN